MSREAYVESTVKRCTTMLGRWKGATAVLHELTVSHKTLKIVLRMADRPGHLLLACIDPATIRAPVQWMNSDLSVVWRGSNFDVIDSNGAVEITDCTVEVHESVTISP